MWIRQILLAVIGSSAGAVAAGGLFAFIAELGVISDFADRTHTGDKIQWYETCVMLGGCWAMALAETLNLFPVFMRRFNLVNCLAGIILGIAAGKTLGCIWILLQEAK